jgi:uncharacterized peroxidase-related enzyme
MEHHGAALHRLTKDEAWVATVKSDYRQAKLTDQQRTMLEYVEKLTLCPREVSEEDVTKLREVGFEDRALLDICQLAAYFNFVNRMAEGLGVELEEEYR